mmetsp:Transcript_127763/g.319033  ORF Transcript_127763/g.319033 Transcript_127763/m.319033 type:complete len:82 (-) Transcript_127763:1137-1382(-)
MAAARAAGETALHGIVPPGLAPQRMGAVAALPGPPGMVDPVSVLEELASFQEVRCLHSAAPLAASVCYGLNFARVLLRLQS